MWRSRSRPNGAHAAPGPRVGRRPILARDSTAAPRPPRRWLPALVVGGALALAACAGSGGGARRPARTGATPRVVTATQLARLDVRDALSALRQLGGPVRLSEGSGSRPITATSRRGRSSLVIADADATVVMLDGVRVIDLLMLRAVPAREVRSIEFLNGIEATTRFGTNSGAGAVLITTGPGAR